MVMRDQPRSDPMLSILLAFLAGVLTVAAPCTLPVLPILLGASVGRRTGARPVFIALGFVVSFAVVVLAFNAMARTLGIDPDELRNAAIALLIVFGILMLWPRPFDALMGRIGDRMRFDRFAGLSALTDNASGFLLGAALGLVWTPCAGPVLASILTVIATSPQLGSASLLLFVYALGAAMPMLAIAYGGQIVTTRIRAVAGIAPRLRQGFGVLVIAFAVAMHFQYDTLITAWLADFYPDGQIGL